MDKVGGLSFRMAFLLFFKALWKFWWALMSSAVFTVIGVYAAREGKTEHWIFVASIAAALVLFFVAAFLAWNEEHKKLVAEAAKRGRPEITASLLTLGKPLQTLLRLENSSQSPAVDIVVRDVSCGKKVLRFSPPASMGGHSFSLIDCEILFSAFKRDDIADLFKEDDAVVNANLWGKGISNILKLEVLYSNLDSLASRRTWVLSSSLWYDYRQQKVFMQRQAIEEKL